MISVIVATDKNMLIGRGNELPWHFKEDLQYFKKMTVGKFVVMGEKTFYSVGKPLPGRKIVVLSKNKELKLDGVCVANSIKEALQKCSGEVMIAGGLSIYDQFMPVADRLYLTTIDKEFEGDVYFPDIDYTQWSVVKEEKGENSLLTFTVWERK